MAGPLNPLPTPRREADGAPTVPGWLAPLADRARAMKGEDLTAFLPPEGGTAREGAVLVLFGDGPDGHDVLLTERAHTMRSQPGQVSFPGGSLEPGETAIEGALREAHEETGLDPDGVEVFAVLPRLYLPPRDFAVAPVLGFWHHDCPVHVTNPLEVHAVFREPIERLLEPAERFVVRHPMGWEGPAWMIGPDRDVLLWGFTAGILNALFDFVGWTRPWDRSVVRPLPSRLVESRPLADQIDHEVRVGHGGDRVAAALIPEPYDAEEPAPPRTAEGGDGEADGHPREAR